MKLRNTESLATPAMAQGLVYVPDLTRVWHRFRLVTGSSTLVAAAVLGVLWGWWGGYITAALAGVAMADTYRRLRNPGLAPMPAMFLDVTLVGVAMVVVQLRPAGIGAPFIYMLVMPALMLPWKRAWWIMGYAMAWTAVALVGFDVTPLTAAVSPGVITAVAYAIFGGHTVALVVVISNALDRSYEAKDQFLAAISHEIRTPLTSILGWSKVLQDEFVTLDASEKAEALQTIESEAEEVTDIIEDLLVAAQLNSGGLAVQKQFIDLATEARAVLATMKLDPSRRIAVRGSTRPALGDPLRIRQIIRNLITNTKRYGGSETWIDLYSAESQCALAVSDDGPGVSQGLQDHIFEPYVQGGGAHRAEQTMGLGLTVSRDLALLMGGDLQYRHAAGVTVFTLTLPSAPPQEPAIVELASDTMQPAPQQG
ncbi:MAG: HAMP domain-containing histidine kinase [Acidobacteria bacterium]|nr:HAMP domain-containing histidine kinase [Acidobacteriota bacterium]